MPTPHFPTSILKNGIKITFEKPIGVKANLNNIFNQIKEEEFNNQSKNYQRLFFSLACFHSVILERLSYGALGWNNIYEWMYSDLHTSNL